MSEHYDNSSLAGGNCPLAMPTSKCGQGFSCERYQALDINACCGHWDIVFPTCRTLSRGAL